MNATRVLASFALAAVVGLTGGTSAFGQEAGPGPGVTTVSSTTVPVPTVPVTTRPAACGSIVAKPHRHRERRGDFVTRSQVDIANAIACAGVAVCVVSFHPGLFTAVGGSGGWYIYFVGDVGGCDATVDERGEPYAGTAEQYLQVVRFDIKALRDRLLKDPTDSNTILNYAYGDLGVFVDSSVSPARLHDLKTALKRLDVVKKVLDRTAR